MDSSREKRIMAFGVFDGFHKGHRYFLTQARQCGDYLIVVVAQDAEVERLKNRKPQFSLPERLKTIEDANIAHTVVAGDSDHGSWQVIRRYQPSTIALGHDQHTLKEALESSLHHLPFLINFKQIDFFKSY